MNIGSGIYGITANKVANKMEEIKTINNIKTLSINLSVLTYMNHD